MRRLHNSYVSVIRASHGNHKVVVVFELKVTKIPTCKSYRL